MPHGFFSADPQFIDLAEYRISARAVNQISPLKHKTSVLLAVIKPTDHLSSKLFTVAERLFGLKELKICRL